MTRTALPLAWMALALALTGAGVAAPPAPDRRSRDEPEVTVEAGGRFGTCDTLQFSADGRHLFAAGDDKVVRLWPVGERGIDPDRATWVTLRWPSWREQRGGIKAVAQSRDGRRLLVGGFGNRTSNMTMLTLTADLQKTLTLAVTWPKFLQGDPNVGEVYAAAFHPDDRRAAFGTADGSLWLWDPKPLAAPDADGRRWSAPARVGKHEAQDKGEVKGQNFPRLLFFPDADHLVSVAESGEVLSCDLRNDPGKVAAEPLFNVFAGVKRRYRVHQAALSADGRTVAVACTGPQVLLRPTDGKPGQVIPLAEGSYPRGLALAHDGRRLAVGVGRLATPAGFYLESHDTIHLYDAPPHTPDTPSTPDAPFAVKPTKVLPHTGQAEALAFHPKTGHLAVAGGDADEVRLLDLAAPGAPLSTVRGSGRKLWGVNLSTNGNVLGIRTRRDAAARAPNARGQGDWATFDLGKLKAYRDGDAKWLDPVPDADGWTVAQDPEDRFTWLAVHAGGAGGGHRHALAINRSLAQAPTCYTFLPARGARPTRLLVGHYYGCTLFELTPSGARPTKLFTGHSAEVYSVVAAQDQEWFVTAGADQTVAAFNLRDWPDHPGLGAALVLDGGRLVVTAVHYGSPASEAGLMPGDVIDELGVKARYVYDHARKRSGATATEAQALDLLRGAVPGEELFFNVSRGGRAVPGAKTTLRQRPLWKWFPAFNEHDALTDWVVWMWKGSYYHTQSANGDLLVGWHVNPPEIDGRPEFYKLNQLEAQYHRRDVLVNLVAGRDVGAALKLARGGNPLPLSFGGVEPALAVLDVAASRVEPEGLAVSLDVRPRGTDPDLAPARVELWLNDCRYRDWAPGGGQALAETLTIPAGQFRDGTNTLKLVALNRAGGRAEHERTVTNDRPGGAPQLLGLSVGVNDYSGHRRALPAGAGGLDDLTSARPDATTLAAKLSGYYGAKHFFKGGQLDARLDARASRGELLDALAAFRKRARPNDQLVLFFAGHGDYLALPADGGRFVFCFSDYAAGNPGQTALSAGELCDALAAINCRKILFLDAYRSKGARDRNLVRSFVVNGQGPTVFAACDSDEEAYDDPSGHGLFTQAVLDALGDDFRRADGNRDGQITTKELFTYLSSRVPSRSAQLGHKLAQTPISYPLELPGTVFVSK